MGGADLAPRTAREPLYLPVLHQPGTGSSQGGPPPGRTIPSACSTLERSLDHMTRTRRLGACTGAAILVATVAPAGASATPVITMSGSTSVAPLAALLAKAYVKQYPGRVKFKLAQGGSDIGVADVAAGRVTIGNSSRDPKPTDPGGIFFNKIARDAICVVTNPANPVADLSQDTIQAIFSGKIRDWSEVPGSSGSGPIDLTVRTPASGTQDAFQKIFMGSASVASSAAQKASNGLIQQTVGP